MNARVTRWTKKRWVGCIVLCIDYYDSVFVQVSVTGGVRHRDFYSVHVVGPTDIVYYRYIFLFHPLIGYTSMYVCMVYTLPLRYQSVVRVFF